MSQVALSDSATEFLARVDWLEQEASRCRMLWMYVIRRAVHDYVITRKNSSMQHRVLHHDAAGWLFSDSVQHFNSFRSLCEVTDTDPEHWRREAKHSSPTAIRRIELLGRRSSPRVRVQ